MQRKAVPPTVLIKVEGADMQERLSRRVANAGYQAKQVRSSAEILDGLDRHQPAEALLWTIERSSAEAIRLLDRLRDRESDLCVILIGPELGAECVSECLRNGAFDYLVTPIRPGRMEESLQQGLHIRHSFREVQGLSAQLRTANQELGRERDSLQRLNHSLVLLNQLAHAMSGTHEADEIIRLVAERVPAILPYDVLRVTWRESERVWEYHANGMNRGTAPSNREVGSVSRATVVRSERPRRSGAFPGDETGVEAIEAPLLSRNEQIGGVRLERLHGKPFGPADREFMMTVATSLALSLANADAHRTLEEMAMKDGLTDLFNRRAFDRLLGQEIKAAERYRSPLCLLFGDVDHFKAINDRFGHPAGDVLLKEVAFLLTDSLREVDIVARYGGEEFAIILPRTDVASGTVLALRIRERIEGHVFMIEGATIHLTLSLGVAGLAPGSTRAREQLVDAADRALYDAKARGRNCVEVYEPASAHARASAYAQP